MKEIIETVSNLNTTEWIGIGFVGLIVLAALPFILWRMIIGIPKLIWGTSKTCAFLIFGGAILFSSMGIAKWGVDTEPRLNELKAKYGEEEGLKKFWSETLPSLPEDKKLSW